MEEKLDKSEQTRLEKVRHSAAHLLAHALTQLYPGIKLTIGPATDTGFFYDFQYQTNLKEEDLPSIEQRMRELSAQKIPLTHRHISKAEAKKIFKDNPFKLELIEGIPEETVGFSEQADFYDLCKGGHVETTGDIKHFKLTGLSGAYWRADKKNAPLQRISGIAFLTEKDLRTYEKQREEALKYDHRKLGKEMDLFSFQPEGVGFPFYHPKGQIVINALKEFMRGLLKNQDYQEVCTPTMLSDELWKRSGHWAHYKENMYFSHIDDATYAIKPMNCPGAFLIYNNRPRSYRELPLKLFEFGHVHRHELSGVLHGLLRVRAFTIDDSHIICTHDQLEQEITNGLYLMKAMLKKTGFESMKVGLATKPAKAMGSDEVWEKATDALKNALEKNNIEYTLKPGDGAFYGPKIEIGIEDSLGRIWQTGTIQVDFFQPENFDLTYIASSGKKERPVIIHQAVYGSLDRFFAILLEHHKGHLPFWLAPVQVRVLPITDDQKEYGQSIADNLKKIGIRVELDQSADPLSGKIKTAQLDRIPWMLIVGGKEMESGTVTLRYPDGKQEFGIKVDDLIKRAETLQ
jgi:threonyl-tRNA synthetase